MKLISWNVNGVRSVHSKNMLVPFIEKEKPDIICLQETKAEKGQSEVDLPEYKEYWNSAKRKGYSGTAIFTKIEPLKVIMDIPEEISRKFKLADDGYGDPNAEGRVITVEFGPLRQPADGGFFLVNVYTPNSKPDLSRLALRHKQWDPAFLAHCKELKKKKPVIVCGDFNVAHTPDDLANPKANEGEHGFTKEERDGIQTFIDAGFVDSFRVFTKGNGHYTWWSHFANSRDRNIGWRLDYFFVSNELTKRIKSSRILPEVYGSDHCPVILEMSE